MSEVYIIPGKKGCEKANQLTGIAIIVDALRASATLATLCEKGVKKILVVSEVEEAWYLKKKFPEALLIGERNNFKIKGFDYSNTPSEIWRLSDLKNKTVIFTSTSGARRIIACREAIKILIGTTINASTVAKIAKNLSLKFEKPIIIIPAGIYGKEEKLAEEDIAASWAIAKRIGFPIKDKPPLLETEFIKKNIKEIFNSSEHGLELIKAGLEEDVNFCAKIDSVSSVPGVIKFCNGSAIVEKICYNNF